MTELLALSSAALWGFGDFTGGYTTRRMPVWAVMAWSQLFGIAVLALGFVIVPVAAFSVRDLAIGAAGGLIGLVGLTILYAALAKGQMSVVAPITGITTAILPVVYDVATGGHLSRLDWLGIGLGVAAVVLLGLDVTRSRMGKQEVLLALGAGTAFAAFFIALSYTSEASGLWPIAGARAVSLPVAALVALHRGVARRPEAGNMALVATAGGLDMAANIALLLALQRGSLAVSTVLSSLYPAFTVLAAVVVLRERPGRIQIGGIVVALAAAGALAA